jgi:hypothetical protein
MIIHQLPALVVEKFYQVSEEKFIEFKKMFPSIFGKPIKQNLIQLYRCDTEFNTLISIQNFLSFLVSDNETCIEYIFFVFDRYGNILAKVSRVLNPYEVLNCYLDELVGTSIDEYGMFSVCCDFKNNDIMKKIGWVSPQFMTIYMPLNINHSPQLIHSHKCINYFPPPMRNITRKSSLVEIGKDIDSLDIFVMNSSKSPLYGNVSIIDQQKFFNLNGLSTAKLNFTLETDDVFNIYSEFDRNVNHKKPLIFRKFKTGQISASHT